MTHPLTTREKVEPFERYPALASWIAKMASVGSGLSMGEWMTFVGALNAAIVQAEQRTALASGSGDHAELARLAEDVEQNATPLAVSLYRHATAPHHVLALLAENAALRAEHVHLVEQKEGAEDALFNALSRATEAERKLAEADRLLERVANDPTWDGPSSARLYFLSKEAERG